MKGKLSGAALVVVLLAGSSLFGCSPDPRTVAEWRENAAEWEPVFPVVRQEWIPHDAAEATGSADGVANVRDDEGAERIAEDSGQHPIEESDPARREVIDATNEW